MRTKYGTVIWKLMPNEYIVGAMLAETLRLRSTVRNFPKPPTGDRITEKRLPREIENASDQLGMLGAATARAAPKHWSGT